MVTFPKLSIIAHLANKICMYVLKLFQTWFTTVICDVILSVWVSCQHVRINEEIEIYQVTNRIC